MCCKIREIFAPKSVFLFEDEHLQDKLWENNLSIWDNGGMNIGSILSYFCLEPIENIMPDNIPYLQLKISCNVMRSPSAYWQLKIDEKNGIQAHAFF